MIIPTDARPNAVTEALTRRLMATMYGLNPYAWMDPGPGPFYEEIVWQFARRLTDAAFGIEHAASVMPHFGEAQCISCRHNRVSHDGWGCLLCPREWPCPIPIYHWSMTRWPVGKPQQSMMP